MAANFSTDDANSVLSAAMGVNIKSRTESDMVTVNIEAWHRRHAIQVAASLPETTEDALLVLELARQLVEGFLAGGRKSAAFVVLDGGNRRL